MLLFLRLLKESFLFAINALVVNKLRTLLSLLGISIGIFTIITVFTIVDSLENNLRGSVQKLGNDVIYVQKWPWAFGGDYPWWKYFQRTNPTLQDYEKLEKRATNSEAMAFIINISNQVAKYRNNSVENVEITATSQYYDRVRTLEFDRGRYFSPAESRSGRNYTLIGHDIAKGLFGDEDPIGKVVKVKGRKVVVIGVIKKEGDDILNNTSDNTMYMPINFVRNLVDIRRDNFGPMILVKAKDKVSLDELSNELRGTLRSVRRLSPREEDDFALNKSSLISVQMESLFGVVNIAGWVIGIFSILVGGFGIANIMFVSVKERTNIIGIQKSLGAKNYFILLQFLVEAVVLSLIGGAIGLIVVFLITLVAMFFDFNLALSLGNILLGLSISAVIGVLSGFVPAYSASQLDPVEAIRAK